MNNNRTANQMDNKKLKVVHQFLIDHNFENTADALMIEATIRGIEDLNKGSKIENATYSASCEELMLSFDTGDWRTFLKLWDLLVPENAKQTRTCKILMLNLHVYFWVTMLPKRMLPANKGKDKSNLSELDSMTRSMNQEDFEHKEIFEQAWIDELKRNVEQFLNNHKPCFSKTKCDVENLNQISSDQAVSSQNLRKGIVPEKLVKSNNIPIVPNDRNIPLFLEEGETEEEYSLCNDINYIETSRSIQTASVNSSSEERQSYISKNKKKLMECTQDLAATKSHLCSVRTSYEKLKLRFHRLHSDYHKLMSIARVLTTALETSAKGESIDFQTMLETCMKIFPDLFNQNVRDTWPNSCSSELLSDKSPSNMKIAERSMSYSMSVSPRLLDFRKIKWHLTNGSIKVKLLLLQALRKKITFGQPGERDEVVEEYISKDLLGLHSKIANHKGKSILPYLLTPENTTVPHPLQQSIARLLNTLASFRCGRDYLSVDSTIVNLVFKCLNDAWDNNIDTVTCNMMIAMLQKLSLRRQQRFYMIDNGLVEWLIHHLYNQGRVMDSYRLEYATALLMNLSLHRVAQRRASVMASLLISTLTTLLLMDHESALQYVNGSLNNFLTNRKINEEAKRMDFSSMLIQYSKRKTGEIRKHLDHILKIHRGEIIIKMEDEEILDNDNDSEEFDILDSQLEENDPVKNTYGELCGEALLASCYMLRPETAMRKETSEDTKANMVDPVLRSNRIKNSCLKHETVVVDEENTHPRQNSKTTVTSSVLLTVGSDTDTTVMEKLSSIASLKDGDSWIEETEEKAFLSKPKLPRTP